MADPLSPQLEFQQSHLPGFPVGDYTIEATQVIESKHSTKIRTDNQFTARLNFTVAGERILLRPEDVQSVFPPDGSLLDHSNVLPHIIFTRSTLPWERNAVTGDAHSPWLALLLFGDGDPVTQSSVKLKDLPASIPGFTLQKGENPEDSAIVIEVPKAFLLGLLPTADELPLLAHVRRGRDANGPVGEERAVLIGNRLPGLGAKTTVHLVALEGRYKKDAHGQTVFDAPDRTVRLMSLKSWSFSCPRRYLLTEEALRNLQDAMPAADWNQLKNLQEVELTGQDTFLAAVKEQLGREAPASYRDQLLKEAEWEKTFRELMLQLNRGALRLPPKGVAETELAAGFVPLPHHFRDGEPLVSWYHGPLLAGPNPSAAWPGPARSADSLVRFYPSTGLLDVSYAAAWELGRLMALSSKAFSTALYAWKRQVFQQALAGRHSDVHDHPLAARQSDAAAPLPPPVVQEWFIDLSLLKHLPFNYLVPDEALLPAESIRFFQIDPLWMDCLFDGAFSVGRVIQQDVDLEARLEKNIFPYRETGLSGVLLRSEAVAGWPDLYVEGYTAASPTRLVQPARRAQLSKNVLLCLFEGVVQAVEVHLKPEGMHFGLDDSAQQEGEFIKELRKADGTTQGQTIDPIPWRDKDRHILNVAGLALAIQQAQGLTVPVTSDVFALEMIESSVRVRFHVS